MNMKYEYDKLKEELWRNTLEDTGASTKAVALALHRGKLTASELEDAQHEIDMEDTLVLTDKQADEWVREDIEEMVWVFTPSFLQAHTGVTADAIEKIQEMCEGANEPLKAMIKDFDWFVEDAVRCDGRGHFLASYDHEENHVQIDDIDYYIYRRN